MQDHGINENMNTLTTIRITSYEKDMTKTTDCPVEESDNESFHSTITTTTKGTTNIWNCPTKQSHKAARTYMIKYEARKNNNDTTTTRPRTATKSSDDRATTPEPNSRPSSRRSSNSSSPTVPRRRSSLGKKKTVATRKPSSTTLHRQSCQIFSSLDGVLALSREFTPLPSVSSSRTATRHHSLIPEENTVAMAQMCEKLDAKLAYTYSYSYSLNTDSTSSIPLGPLKSEPEQDNNNPNTSTNTNSTAQEQHQPPRRTSLTRHSSQHQHQGIPVRPPLNTVISWTSDATRQKEYEKIDRAHSGLRGIVRRILPRYMLSKNLRRGFFTGKCDGDSVRRFRVDVKDKEKGKQERGTLSCFR